VGNAAMSTQFGGTFTHRRHADASSEGVRNTGSVVRDLNVSDRSTLMVTVVSEAPECLTVLVIASSAMRWEGAVPSPEDRVYLFGTRGDSFCGCCAQSDGPDLRR